MIFKWIKIKCLRLLYRWSVWWKQRHFYEIIQSFLLNTWRRNPSTRKLSLSVTLENGIKLPETPLLIEIKKKKHILRRSPRKSASCHVIAHSIWVCLMSGTSKEEEIFSCTFAKHPLTKFMILEGKLNF